MSNRQQAGQTRFACGLVSGMAVGTALVRASRGRNPKVCRSLGLTARPSIGDRPGMVCPVAVSGEALVPGG
jgi:hypothetical protein